MKPERTQSEPKTKLLDAAIGVFRAKGYTATTVEDICLAAGVTKGSFFHHFKTKEQLAVETAAHFGDMARKLFDAAPYRQVVDPLDRLLGYVDFRIGLLRGGALPQCTCLLGTMVQEVFDTNPQIRAACEREFRAHDAEVARDIAAAKERYTPDAPWSAESLAAHMAAVGQGSFILAKATNGPESAVECMTHLRRYLEMLFGREAVPNHSPSTSGDLT